MAPIAIVFGVLLVALSGISYLFAEAYSPTIFIPSFVGVPLIILGVIAMKESARKHAMHVAAVLGLLGFVLPLGRVIYASIQNGFVLDLKSGSALGMAALSGAFLVLCIKSFIDVRAARKQREGQASP